MNVAQELFNAIADLQRIRIRVEKLNKRFKLERIYPGNYDLLMNCIHEASSDIADFWIVFTEPKDINI